MHTSQRSFSSILNHNKAGNIPFRQASAPIIFPFASSTPCKPRLNIILNHQIRTAYVGLRPRKMKFQKAFKGFFKSRPNSLRATNLAIGNYGLRVTEGGRIKDKQLDQLRTVVRRVLKEEKDAKFYFRIFTSRPVSKKAAETRMGKGKGAVEYFATWVSRGRVIFEVKCDRKDLALKALRIAANALPLRTSVIEVGKKGHRGPPRALPHFIKKRLDAAELKLHLEKRTAQEIERGVRAKEPVIV
ncbi:hypothetical protein HDU97_001286 [Phlyctochytrium planicorne]|nr:hypothetical protein HDU97_001286 [Phlyctochytrium planicorne]